MALTARYALTGHIRIVIHVILKPTKQIRAKYIAHGKAVVVREGHNSKDKSGAHKHMNKGTHV
eukprot:6201626-Pleurochrysis_carterae.AAC.2